MVIVILMVTLIQLGPAYEWRRKLITEIHANLVFQAYISALRCFRTLGTPKRKILMCTGMLPYLVP